MKTLIVFSTKYGATEKCAELVKKGLNHEVNLANLRNSKSVNLKEYDNVIIGGSVYVGKIQKEIAKFVDDNKKDLQTKQIGLFVCCKFNGDKAMEQIKNSLPDWVVNKAFAKEYLGHELSLEKMSFMDKLITKSVVRVKESYSDLKTENINRLINTINRLDGISG